MKFSWYLAIRYFRSGGVQTVLTVTGVAVGVSVFIFISALIDGLQVNLIDRVIGSISHVTIDPEESDPVAPETLNGNTVFGTVAKTGMRERKIGDWQSVMGSVERDPQVIAVSPLVTVSGFVTKGQQVRPITFRGIDPERYVAILDLANRMVEGVLDVSGQRCVIGVDLAEDLGVGVGSIIRTTSAEGVSTQYVVAGIFDVGVSMVNQQSFFVSIPNAQRAGDLVGFVSAIETKVSDVFTADVAANRISRAVGLPTRSWMEENRDFLVGLRGQSGSSNMIKLFVMVSVAFGIASVLAITVVQRSREIGILKSMGTRTSQIVGAFMFLGLLVGAFGSVMGVLFGGGLSLAVGGTGEEFRRGEVLFPIRITASLIVQSVVISMVIGVLAAVAPARRAAQIDPVEVIRYG